MTKQSHILVVDDEPNVLVTYRLILEQQGYRVSAAVSSEEALQVLNREPVDVLLCDLSLERQESGFHVIEFARNIDPDLPSVLLTGYATQEANDRAISLGIPVLFKPIDIRQLLQTIDELLKGLYEQRKTG